MPYTLFPLYGITRDEEGVAHCACPEEGCTRAGKHPAYPYSTLEPGQQVRGRDGQGHAMVTGWKSNVIVVDTDGPEADARYRARCTPEELQTFTVATPSGGRHYWYVWPGFPVATTSGKLLRLEGETSSHIDVRGDVNGLVVLPGSPHKSGRAYAVDLNVPVAAVPAWVAAEPSFRGSQLDASSSEAVWPPFPVDVETELGQRRLEMGRVACETMRPSLAGQDGSGALWELSLHLVRDLELPLEVAGELVAEVFNARCSPAWTHVEIAHKLKDARDKSDRAPGMITDVDLGKVITPEVPAGVESRRKTKSPGHRYVCDLSSVSAMQPGKTTFGRVLELLSGNVEDWRGVLQYDEFRDRIVAVDPPIELEAERTCFVERDVTAVRKWFEVCAGAIVAKDTAWDCVISVAHRNRFHPVRDYLQGLPAGDPKDLEQAATVFFGSRDPLDIVMVRKFLIGAVRRIMRPGEKLDTMLVLVGDQGAFKSSFIPALFGREWTSEDLADLTSKDAMIGLAGKWVIEVAELDKILRQDPETVKSFMTRQVDPYRAPYERVSTDHPRQCCYVGTTNKDDFLRDPTGERRYWIVDLRKTGAGEVDLASVRAWRDRIWAAAYAVASQPNELEPHWLTAEEGHALKKRASHYKGESGWFDAVRTYCTGRDFVTVDAIFKSMGGSTDKLDKKATVQITDILRELGCEKSVQGSAASRKRGWLVPESLLGEELGTEEANRRAGEAMIGKILGETSKA